MRRPLALLVSASLLSACGFNHTDAAKSSRPTRATGTAARVMMPGESAPSLEEQQAPPTDEEVTMLGGGSTEGDATEKVRDVPLGPLAVLFGYPFWAFGKTIQQKTDEAAEERKNESAEEQSKQKAAQGGTGRDKAERQRLADENEKLKQQLGQRAAAPQPARPRTPSVREELAALERSLGKTAPPSVNSGNAASSAPAPAGNQTAQADRNGDGREDRWLANAEGQGSRETLDEDGDGKVDRVLHYDAQRVLTQVEEDADHDGSLETVSLFEGGKVSRKRSDQNGDGQPDSWSFYRGGDLMRMESDQNGDGFRDRVAVYQNGELAREEEDRNADGQPDLLTHYKAGEIAEKHEDVDYDGKLDMASYYEKGRLVRRELSSPDVLELWGPQGGN